MDELEQIATRYLLGELSEQEQAALEESYYRDANVFNEVLRVESELVDAYARGQLSTEMRDRFERSYLQHPARRNRVEFARALTTKIDERSLPAQQRELRVSWMQRLLAVFGGQGRALRFATALIILAVALAGVWIFINNRRRQQREAALIEAQREIQQRREQERTLPQQPTETPQPEQRAAQTPIETSQPSPSSAPQTVTLALTVGAVRGANGGATQTLIIPHETTQAELLLDLKDDSYTRYRVSLQKVGGGEIFTQTNIRPRSTKAGARFLFKVPAKQLTNGEYALTLGGITPEGDVDDLSKSLFRVEKR